MHSGFFANQGAVATLEPDGGKEGTGGSGGGDGGGTGDGELNIRKKKKVRRKDGRQASGDFVAVHPIAYDLIGGKPLYCRHDVWLPSRWRLLVMPRLIVDMMCYRDTVVLYG